MDTEERTVSDRNAVPHHTGSRRTLCTGRTDEALCEQAEILATGQRLARMGSVAFDVADKTWTISETWARHVGLDHTVLSRDEVYALIPVQDHPITRAAFQRFFSDDTHEYEHRIIHAKTGETLHVRAYARLVRDGSGKPQRIIGAVQDITEQKRAELALQASEQRFRSLFDTMPLSLAVWQRQGDDFVLTAVNPASVTLTDGQIGTLLGSRLSDFYSDTPWIMDLIWRCHRQGTVEHVERRYRFRATGKETDLSLKFAPAPPDIALVVAEDVSERIATQSRLRETTDLMVAGQRLGRMGSFEYDLETGRWSLSETWRELSGAETNPTTTEELLAWVHPDDRARVMEDFRAALRGESHQMEHRVIHCRTGETLYLRAYGNLVNDDDSRPTRYRGLVQDITEEKRREQALADSLMRLTVAQEIAGIGSTTIDPMLEHSDWSAQMYRIFERDPTLGPPRLGDHADLYTAKDYRHFRDSVDAAVADAVPFDLTVPLHMPDGRVKWIHILGRAMPHRGPAGHVVHATVQDITARKREQEFREDIERIIRHDMRSPVAATISGINILRLSDTLSDDNRLVLDMMERSAQRQLSLLDASMALYRMEAGTFHLVPAPVDLRQVMEEVREELEYLVAERSAQIRVTATAPVIAVGDAWLCRTLLSNLVRNALEALPAEHLSVEVGLAADGGEAVVRITNAGAVPDAVRERFFEKYATGGKPGGTGLGTYSARMMAQAQGGRVALDTRVAGQTTVTVRLPLADADQARHAARQGNAHRVAVASANPVRPVRIVNRYSEPSSTMA